MKSKKLARFCVLGLFVLLTSVGLRAQQVESHVKIVPVPQQNGWYDVQFTDGTSEYSLKALMAEKADKNALINRLYVDEVRHVARIEVIDKQKSLQQVQLAIEKIMPGYKEAPARRADEAIR